MKDSVQNEINRNVRGELDELHKHADIANGEMGAIKLDMASVKGDIKYMTIEMAEQRETIEKVDSKTWWILATLILGILIEIGFTLFRVLRP